MAPGPFTLPSAENVLNEKRKRAAIREVKKWAESYIPNDILEKHDYKLKKTFQHTDTTADSIRVRSNHTISELTGVLRDFGGK